MQIKTQPGACATWGGFRDVTRQTDQLTNECECTVDYDTGRLRIILKRISFLHCVLLYSPSSSHISLLICFTTKCYYKSTGTVFAVTLPKLKQYIPQANTVLDGKVTQQMAKIRAVITEYVSFRNTCCDCTYSKCPVSTSVSYFLPRSINCLYCIFKSATCFGLVCSPSSGYTIHKNIR